MSSSLSSSTPPASPSKAATSSSSNASSSSTTASAASAARAQHKTPEATAQMTVLGMDGTDLEMPSLKEPPTTDDRKMAARPSSGSLETSGDAATSGSAPSSPTPVRQQPPAPQELQNSKRVGVVRTSTKRASAANRNRNWLDRILWGGPPDELGAKTNYTSLGTPSASTNIATTSEFAAASADAPSENGSNAAASNTSTVEDQLRQDCSFFYQGIEDPIQQKRAAALTPLSTLDNKVPRVLSSRDGAIFHAKYQRLNQTIVLQDDLELTEEGDETSSNLPGPSDASRNISISDIQNSSLFYHQDGRLLMRLPRDQMRLIMDHDLEPGILSVEQWRCVDGEEISPTSGEPMAASGPDLRYVMTVPDDLYRRVVSEMSYHYNPPYCGFFKCWHDTERADIRLALIVLSVLLILLFIGTMDWPTD